jgi:hypothetical protein
MVSSELMAEIEHWYEVVRYQSIDPHKYSGESFDVVCEIITADTFVAGIASKLLDGSTIDPIERQIIGDPLITDQHWWKRGSGQKFDFHAFPEICQVVQSLEKLRSLCKDALG